MKIIEKKKSLTIEDICPGEVFKIDGSSTVFLKTTKRTGVYEKGYQQTVVNLTSGKLGAFLVTQPIVTPLSCTLNIEF